MRQRIFDTAGRTGRRALTQGAGGWDLNDGTLNCAIPSKEAVTIEYSENPSREAAPSERPSCRLKAFLKCVQITTKPTKRERNKV